MAKFDLDKETEKIIENIKNDLTQIDATIELLIHEASARSGNHVLKYHEIATPLTKLMSSKQKSLDQLLKIIEAGRTAQDEETTFDIDGMYSEFENVPEEEKIK